MKEATHDAISL